MYVQLSLFKGSKQYDACNEQDPKKCQERGSWCREYGECLRQCSQPALTEKALNSLDYLVLSDTSTVSQNDKKSCK